MASINRLKPGQIVYEVRRSKCGNTTVSRGNLYELKIIKVNLDENYVIASWNGNPAQTYRERSIKKWKVKKPKPKTTVFGDPSY